MEPLHGEASCSSVLGQPTLVLRVACREVAEAAPARPATPLRVLLALDRSGSMSGSPIQAAKRAACVFAQHVAGCASELALAGLGLLCFDNQVEAIDLFGQPASSIERLIDSVEVRGGTSFAPVLSAIHKSMLGAPDTRHFVVFLTDGQAFDGTEGAEAIATLQAASGSQSLTVHTLGFGHDHDAAFLAVLTLAGSSQGSFQYLQSVDDIEGSMDRVMEELDAFTGAAMAARLSATLLLGPASAGSEPTVGLPAMLKAEAERQDGAAEVQAASAGAGAANSGSGPAAPAGLASPALRRFRGHVVLDSPADLAAAELGAALEVQLPSAGDGAATHRLPLALRHEELPLGSAASLALELVKSTLIGWTARLANSQLARQELKGLRDGRLAVMRRELAAMQPRVRELLGQEGREAFRLAKSQLLEAAALLNSFESGVLAEALSGTLSNRSVAGFNHQAYALLGAGATRKGLAKRVGQNLDLVEQTQAAVAVAVEQLEASGRLAALPALDDVGCCAISCMDYREALQAGDCLCLGLDIERPEAAVMDPSRLVVKAIAPTRISAESFMDALRFSLSQKGPEEVHGGFGARGSASAGAGGPCVVPGEGREAITGALPLWLCDEHWAAARLLARPLLGWMATLSPLGYSEEQLRAVPFLVLSRALQDLEDQPSGTAGAGAGAGSAAGASPFRRWVADQVTATCRAVYRMRRWRILAGLLHAGEEQQAAAMEVEGGAAQAEQAVVAAAPAAPAEEEEEEEEAAAVPTPAGSPQQQRLAFLAGGPAARTVDVVPSVEVLLGHLLCAVLQGDIHLQAEDWQLLRLAVAEEELRRCQPGGCADAAALLGIDAATAGAAVLARWTAAHPGSEDVAPTMAQLEAAAAELASEVDWPRQLGGPHVQPAIAAAQRAYGQRVRPLLCLLARIEALAGAASRGDTLLAAAAPGWQPPARLADWLGVPSLAALLLQNGQGARNAQRRAYLDAGRYVDPFGDPEALLRRHWQQEAMAAVRTTLEELRSAAYLRAATSMAERFAAAATLEAAADAIQGWQLGRPFIAGLLLTALRQPGVPEPIGKMRLLVQGSLGARALRGDKQRGAGSSGDGAAGAARDAAAAGATAAPWVPCRAAVYGFLREYHRQLLLDEALQLFQGCCGVDRPYLEMQYAAGFDPTSPLTHRRPRRGLRQRGEGGGTGGKGARKRGGQAQSGQRKRTPGWRP